MISCLHFQNKVLSMDGVKVKLQVRSAISIRVVVSREVTQIRIRL